FRNWGSPEYGSKFHWSFDGIGSDENFVVQSGGSRLPWRQMTVPSVTFSNDGSIGFAVFTYVDWFNSAGGNLGEVQIATNAAGDYTCTSSRPCGAVYDNAWGYLLAV